MYTRSPEPAGLASSLSEEMNRGWPGPTLMRPRAADALTSGTGPDLRTHHRQIICVCNLEPLSGNPLRGNLRLLTSGLSIHVKLIPACKQQVSVRPGHN